MINLKKLGDNVAVRCRTDEEDKKLKTMADEQGIVWIDGSSCLNWTVYQSFQDKTCYFGFNTGKIAFGVFDWFNENGYIIIEFSELEQYLNSEEKKEMPWYEAVEMLDILEEIAKCSTRKGNCGDCEIRKSYKGKACLDVISKNNVKVLSTIQFLQNEITKLKQEITELKSQLETKPSVEPIKGQRTSMGDCDVIPDISTIQKTKTNFKPSDWRTEQ